MSRLIRTYPLLTIWRIALLYVVLMLCRVAFVLYNTELLCPIAWSEVPALIEGALRFDTVSIIYANCLWIVLSLLPFRFRENKIYSDILYWLYVVVNSIAVVAINMCDAVYFIQTFTRVIIPLTMPGIVSAATMVFMPTISSYVISDILSEYNVVLFGTYIDLYFNQNDWNFGSFMALIMLVLILLSVVITRKFSNEDEGKESIW